MQENRSNYYNDHKWFNFLKSRSSTCHARGLGDKKQIFFLSFLESYVQKDFHCTSAIWIVFWPSKRIWKPSYFTSTGTSKNTGWVFGKLFRGEHLCKVYNLQTNTTILARKVKWNKVIRYIHNTLDEIICSFDFLP